MHAAKEKVPVSALSHWELYNMLQCSWAFLSVTLTPIRDLKNFTTNGFIDGTHDTKLPQKAPQPCTDDNVSQLQLRSIQVFLS